MPNQPNKTPQRYVLASLGCKVNQAEEAYLQAAMEERGLSPAEPGRGAQVAVLLTCSVTAAAARQSRQMARRLARAHPGCRVLVTGCDAQAEPEAYRSEGFAVVGRALLKDAPDMAAGALPLPAGDPPEPEAGPWCPGERAPLAGKSRGLLKVQDGCDACCAYCIVPFTRGGPRSLPPKEAAEAFARLGRAGAKEVVLTGIHLGRYGQDLGNGHNLSELIKALLAAHPEPRLRLSSLEVNEITPGLIELLGAEERLCRHLHIPLQSGSEQVLAAMGRPYAAALFARTVEELAGRIPGICLGADVLAGLPSEDQRAHHVTLKLLESLPISYLHVFPYSPRPGTRAAAMPGRPEPKIAKQRAAQLRALGRAKQEAFWASQVGQSLNGVVEESGKARTGNYCLVELEQRHAPASRVRLRVTELVRLGERSFLRGRTLPDTPSPL